MDNTNTEKPPLLVRLRTMAAIGWNPIGDEAADRIVELGAEIERLKRQHQEELFNAVQQAERPIMAEIAKLNKRLDEEAERCRVFEESNIVLLVENAKLREAIDNALLCDTAVQISEALQAALVGGKE